MGSLKSVNNRLREQSNNFFNNTKVLKLIIVAIIAIIIGSIIPIIGQDLTINSVFLGILVLLLLFFGVIWLSSLDLFSPTLIPIAYLIYYTAGYGWKYTSGIVDKIPIKVAVYVLVGLIGYAFGMFIFSHGSMTLKRVSGFNFMQEMNTKRLWLIIGFSIMAGLAALAITLRPTGYNISLMGDLVKYRSSFQGLPGWLSVFLNLLKIAAVLIMIYSFQKQSLSGKRRLLIICLVSIIAILTLTTGSRTIFLQLLAYWILLRHYLYKQWSVSKVALLSVIGGLMIGGLLWIRQITFADYYTRSFHLSRLEQRGVNVDSPINIFLYLLFSHARTGVETFTMVLEMIPTRIPFQLGTFTTQSLLTLLPGKQYNPSIFVTDKILGFGTYTEIPPTLLGGFYIDFGPTGIFVGMFLIAVILNWTYIIAKRGSLLAKVIYISLLIEILISHYSMVLGSIRPLIDITLLAFSLSFVLVKKTG